MSTGNQFETVNMVKLSSNFISKEPACTTRRNSPGLNILRITPYQIAKGTFVWDFLCTSNDTYLVNSADFRAQTSMYAKDLAIYYSCEDKKVKDLAARLPNRCIAIFLLALLVEAVNLGDLTRFVVTSNES